MTGPDGDGHGASGGSRVDRPTSLEFTDAFAETDRTPLADAPVSKVTVQLIEREGGTRIEMQVRSDSPRTWSGSWTWVRSMGCDRP